MQPETVNLETLESLLGYLAAHVEHEAIYREALPRGKGEKGVRKVARSAARPVIFADSESKTVQVELSYWKGGDQADRRVVIWQAEKGTPPEVEMLRQLRGKAVLRSAFLEVMRCLMPAEPYAEMKAAIGHVVLVPQLRGDVAQLCFEGGALAATAPELGPISWTVDHGSATLALPVAAVNERLPADYVRRVQDIPRPVDQETVDALAREGLRPGVPAEAISGATPAGAAAAAGVPEKTVLGIPSVAALPVPTRAPAQFRLTLRPQMSLSPDRRAVLCSYSLDVEDAFETPAAFRRYVSGFDWQSVGAVVVFGKPEEPVRDSVQRRRVFPSPQDPAEVEIEVDVDLFRGATPRAMEGMLRRVVQAATGERPPIPQR